MHQHSVTTDNRWNE